MTETMQGSAHLAGAITRLSQRAVPTQIVAEIGQIDETFGLVIVQSSQTGVGDGEPIRFAMGTYTINHALALPIPDMATTASLLATGTHGHGGGGHGGHNSGDGGHAHAGDGVHVHNVATPDQLYPLQPGDVVLVIWVKHGTEPVVVCRLASSAALALTATLAYPGAPGAGGGPVPYEAGTVAPDQAEFHPDFPYDGSAGFEIPIYDTNNPSKRIGTIGADGVERPWP